MFYEKLIQNRAFANVLMVVLLAGGLASALLIRQQLMPDRIEPILTIEVELPGASPGEVEQSVLTVIENAVRGLKGVRRVTGKAMEGMGQIDILMAFGVDQQKMLGDVKNRVDRITTLPRQARAPVISLSVESEKALSVVVYGDQPRVLLQQAAENIRNDLVSTAGLTRVEMTFSKDHEISVELDENTLEQTGLSLSGIAQKIEENTTDLSGGTLYTSRWDTGLRTNAQKHTVKQIGTIPVIAGKNGQMVYLSDIADVRQTLATGNIECWFNGHPAVVLDIFAVDGQSPGDVAQIVKQFIRETACTKYNGVEVQIFENQAAAYHSRMMLLVENALTGLVLVLGVLWLFLTPTVAFWVTAGIPVALFGGLMLMYLMGLTINMLSLFAFIITIGVVVDDAIIMGEAIHFNRDKGMNPFSAALKGCTTMGGPLLMAVSTTILAFLPMCFVPGEMGNLFLQIPGVIIPVLLVSLIESLVILPAHLSGHGRSMPGMALLAAPQEKINRLLSRFVNGRFHRILDACIKAPLLVFVTALCLLAITFAAVSGGWLNFSMTPTIDADTVIAQATLPYGSAESESVAIQARLVRAAKQVFKQSKMKSEGLLSLIGTRLEEGEVEVETLAGTHYISVLAALPKAEERTLSSREFAVKWQKAFGDSGRLEAINFTGETNISGGEPIQIELMHPDRETARKAALALGTRMRTLAGLSSIDDGVRTGKPELRFSVNEQGLLKGLTTQSLGEQIRNRFHGIEAAQFIHNGQEVTVRVRLNKTLRSRLETLDRLRIKLDDGGFVPLSQVASVSQDRSATKLMRRDGVRIYPVSADIAFGYSDDDIEDALEDDIIPDLVRQFPGLQVRFGGEEEENSEALTALGAGFAVVLSIMYLLMVYVYHCPIKPLLVLCVIPFAVIGAVWGHILLGYDLSIISVVGIIAMTGVVVNDAIVLLSGVYTVQGSGIHGKKAVLQAACDRFRPILLTTLTTCLGLLPLMLESSEQAQFLIPAAVSMAFGLMIGTFITLLLFPVLLCVFVDKPEHGQINP